MCVCEVGVAGEDSSAMEITYECFNSGCWALSSFAASSWWLRRVSVLESWEWVKGGVHCDAEALPESGVLDRHSVRCVFAIGLAKSERKRGGPDIVGPG